ncbi:MAG TPA: TetR family transcriptional regulator [Acidimicrobiia bacterium]|jgi:TetR/AcrR family transcriptional repressor of nem operon
MPRSGEATRQRILDAAEQLVYGHGFAAASLDKVVALAGVTKGALFYHFDSKAELGHAVVERFAARDRELLESTMARAERLSDDPLQQFLVVTGLIQEDAERHLEPAPGCLFASFIYEHLEYPEAVGRIAQDAFLAWRERLVEKLDAAVALHRPAGPFDTVDVADLFTTVIEGGYVMAKVLGDGGLLGRHLAHYRRYVAMLFTDAAG